MKSLLNKVPRYLFFTGKGGVGTTSMACVAALGLAEQGKQVLLISTDPASNLDEVLEAVKTLLPRVRDPKFTKVLIVALAEATPTHEAAALQEDLQRAGIAPFGWIVNRCFAFSGTRDPALCAKGVDELFYLNEILDRHAQKMVISPWVARELNGFENLRHLHAVKQ